MSVMIRVMWGGVTLVTMLAVWALTVIKAREETERRAGEAYWEGVDNGKDAARERRQDRYTNEGEGMLVVAVHPEVAEAGVEALRGLTEKQMMGLICVANRIQNELVQAGMKTRDARNEMLDMARGVGVMLGAVRNARTGEKHDKAKAVAK